MTRCNRSWQAVSQNDAGRLEVSIDRPGLLLKSYKQREKMMFRRATNEMNPMNAAGRYDVLVPDSGTAGKLMAWTMAKEGRRTAVVERKYIGGFCPNVTCLPSKNIIH